MKRAAPHITHSVLCFTGVYARERLALTKYCGTWGGKYVYENTGTMVPLHYSVEVLRSAAASYSGASAGLGEMRMR